jgi:Tfp pilus assembly protein PilZ
MICRLRSGIRSHSGMVLDVSTTGVFVQTTARFEPGGPVSLVIHVPRGKHFALEGEVARVVVSSAGRDAGQGCGLGVLLKEAPAAYVAWVESLVGKGTDSLRVSGGRTGAAVADPQKSRSFQVRLRQIAGNRTRDVLVRCGSQAEASELALAEFDEDWKVLRVAAE